MLSRNSRNHWVGLSLPVIFGILSLQHLLGQNIVSNPSFELKSTVIGNDCSILLGYNEKLDVWCGINSVDLIHNDYLYSNRSGKQKIYPHRGKAMTGLYLVDAGDGWLQELLFQKLNTPLQAGSRYRLSLFIHFRSMDAYYPQQINFNFTDKDPCGIPISEFPPNYNSIPLKDSSLNDSVWIQVSSEFIAKSNDNFLVIGSFVPSSPLTKKKGKRVNHGVYIFLDEISLENLESGFLVDTIVQAIAIQENPQPKLQERTVLSPNLNPILTEKLESFSAIPSISFNHNSSELSTVYQKILSEIAPVLKEGNCQIIISGHTDNTGDEDFNKALSKRRAKVVADFLGKLGLDTNRIIIHGFSSQEPVAAGIDEFSRSLNRRVEIVKKCN